MYTKIIICGYPSFFKLAKESLKDIPVWVDYEIKELPLEFLNSPQKAQKNIKSLFDPGAIIISGDRSSSFLKEIVSNFVIPVKLTGFGLLDIIKQVDSDEIVIMNYGENLEEISNISSLLKIKVRQIPFNNTDEAHKIFEQLKNEGVTHVVGGSWVSETAKNYGMTGVFYYSQRSFTDAFQDALNIQQAYRRELEKITLFKTIVDINRSGVITTDSDDRINVISKMTEALLGMKSKQIVGKKVHEIIPDYTNKYSELTEKGPQYNLIFEHNQNQLLADVAPIIVQGERMGQIIILDDVVKLQKKEQNIRKKINQKPMVSNYSFDDIIGSSAAMKETINQAKKYSSTNSSILIHGESGTGKELFAQSIHQASSRSLQPFVAVNCAALPESLIDSELFGYEEGAFTGARKGGKPGLFELAHQGTIFLDEISELPLHLQSRLLRVLQEKEVVRVGGNQVIPINVRIIAASNKNLLERVRDGEFREDLYYRISVLQIYIPSLRQRKEDIPSLFFHFIKNRVNTLENDINLEALLSYQWPGNVRELENVAERFLVLSQDEKLNPSTIQSILREALFPKYANQTLNEQPEVIKSEADEIFEALMKADGNKEKAADLLGISRTTLWRKMKENDIKIAK